MSEVSEEYTQLLKLLADIDANSLLAALSEAKTGKREYEDFLPMRLYEELEVDLNEFIKGLQEHPR